MPVHSQIPDSADIRIAVSRKFHSKVLNEDRRIHIYTPPGMSRTGQYPVLYLLDGESFIELVSGQVEYLSQSYKIIPAMIIVGIGNTDRMRDLTPTHTLMNNGRVDSVGFKNTGGGEKFLKFIRTELIPYIDSNYPTAPYRVLAGHSLGGLMSVYSMVNYPEDFDAYIAASPSFQWDNEMMLKQVATFKPDNRKKKILFFSDADEGKAFHANQLIFDSLLKKKSVQHKYIHYPEESHISEPVKAFYDGIRYIYPDWHLPYNSSAFRKEMTSDTIIKHYQRLSQQYGYKVIPPENEISQIARFLRNDPARINDAIELLKMNAINFPKSVSVFDLLGDTYLKSGDKKNAETNFKQALILDPGNDKIRQKLSLIQ
jgi:predicted alpha/beta superfamily hydrolase